MRLETSKGVVVVEARRDWAPHGADRFYNLVRHGYYDEARFFRVVAGRWAQFGSTASRDRGRLALLGPCPTIRAACPTAAAPIAYAFAVPNGRTTQVFINLRGQLGDPGCRRLRPVRPRRRGMAVVDALNAEYGESAGGGIRGGKQDPLFAGGNAYLKEFPRLDPSSAPGSCQLLAAPCVMEVYEEGAMTAKSREAEAIVVGAGSAGWPPRHLVPRRRRVVLLRRPRPRAGARAPGPRRLPLQPGPHALYRAGRAAAVLRELGVAFERATRRSRAPTQCAAACSTRCRWVSCRVDQRVVRPREKVEAARLLAGLAESTRTRSRESLSPVDARERPSPASGSCSAPSCGCRPTPATWSASAAAPALPSSAWPARA